MRSRNGLTTVALFASLPLLACRGGSPASASTEDERAPTGVTFQAPIEVDVGDAYQGPWRMNESEFHYVDDPTVAATADSRFGVAWVDNRRRDVLFQRFARDGGAELPKPTNVSRSPDVFSWLPRLSFGSDSTEVFVLWQEIVFSGGSHGGEIFFAFSTDGGTTFSAPQNLSNTTAGAGKGRLSRQSWHNGSIALERGQNGELWAAWTEYEGRLMLSRSTDRGRSFSAPLRVAGSDAEPARGPTLAAGMDGKLFLGFTVGEDPSADIRVARSDDGGQTFSALRVVRDTKGHSDAPALGMDGRGTLHLVYAESRGGPNEPYGIVHLRLDGELATRGEPVSVFDPRRGREAAGFPSLAFDDKGRMYVVFEHYPDHARRPHGLGFAFSTDGTSFSTPGLVPGTRGAELGSNGGRQGLLMEKISVSHDGTIGVVNSSFDRDRASRVRLIRGSLD